MSPSWGSVVLLVLLVLLVLRDPDCSTSLLLGEKGGGPALSFL
jgi:hypothetical protein